MQRMSYIYILYFYNQQSMQNQTYPLAPFRQRFQPIQVELQNGKQSKEVDFKLFVLLILIVFLGFLINKHEEQFDTQPETTIQTNDHDEITQLSNGNLWKEKDNDSVGEIKENEESFRTKKQLYSSDKTLQQTRGNSSSSKDVFSKKQQSEDKQNQFNRIKQGSSVENEHQNTQQKRQNQTQEKPEQSQTQKTKARRHHKLMRKYIEFYFWFPFFIFALIVYSCYQKQNAVSSMFIQVRKSNNFDSTEECAICITEMKRQDLLAVLPCSSKHLFHSGCIKEWLTMKKTCPICRKDVRMVGRGE